MQRQLTPIPVWVTIAAIIVAVALTVFLACTLRKESTVSDTNDRVLQSSLLPDDWSTYGADVWSLGYPNTWEIDSTLLGTGGPSAMHRLHFHPADMDDGDYLLFEKEVRSSEQVEADFRGTPGVTRSEFRFAGYPAVKFSTYQRDEYYISYDEDIYRIATDHPTDNEVGIMLATVKFVE